jgi:hypothetical protein
MAYSEPSRVNWSSNYGCNGFLKSSVANFNLRRPHREGGGGVGRRWPPRNLWGNLNTFPGCYRLWVESPPTTRLACGISDQALHIPSEGANKWFNDSCFLVPLQCGQNFFCVVNALSFSFGSLSCRIPFIILQPTVLGSWHSLGTGTAGRALSGHYVPCSHSM